MSKTTLHELGFRQLDPIPSSGELAKFYGEDYYESLDTADRRGPELQRLLAETSQADPEREWLEKTLYTDVRHYLSVVGGPPGKLLDVGCGTGDFIASMNRAGWEATGIELSAVAVEACSERGLAVERAALAQLDTECGPYDAITMFNVLEHVPDPCTDLELAVANLAQDGCIVVQVPNDFSVLQMAASDLLGHEPWWIARPDHINYFSFASLTNTLRSVGLEPVVTTCSFPMELFLLLGTDYIADPKAGGTAHKRRQSLELGLSAKHRRDLAEAFAAGNLGRNCVIIAKRSVTE